jgi:hypothetical protein
MSKSNLFEIINGRISRLESKIDGLEHENVVLREKCQVYDGYFNNHTENIKTLFDDMWKIMAMVGTDSVHAESESTVNKVDTVSDKVNDIIDKRLVVYDNTVCRFNDMEADITKLIHINKTISNDMLDIVCRVEKSVTESINDITPNNTGKTLCDINGRLDNIEKTFAQADRIDHISSKFNDTELKLTARVDDIQNKLSHVENKLVYVDDIRNKLGCIEDKLNHTENKLVHVEKIDGISDKVDDMGFRLAICVSDVGNTLGCIEKISNVLDKYDNMEPKLMNYIDSIQNKVISVENKLDQVEKTNDASDKINIMERNLTNCITNAETKLVCAETKLVCAETKFVSNETKLSCIENKLVCIENKMNDEEGFGDNKELLDVIISIGKKSAEEIVSCNVDIEEIRTIVAEIDEHLVSILNKFSVLIQDGNFMSTHQDRPAVTEFQLKFDRMLNKISKTQKDNLDKLISEYKIKGGINDAKSTKIFEKAIYDVANTILDDSIDATDEPKKDDATDEPKKNDATDEPKKNDATDEPKKNITETEDDIYRARVIEYHIKRNATTCTHYKYVNGVKIIIDPELTPKNPYRLANTMFIRYETDYDSLMDYDEHNMNIPYNWRYYNTRNSYHSKDPEVGIEYSGCGWLINFHPLNKHAPTDESHERFVSVNDDLMTLSDFKIRLQSGSLPNQRHTAEEHKYKRYAGILIGQILQRYKTWGMIKVSDVACKFSVMTEYM